MVRFSKEECGDIIALSKTYPPTHSETLFKREDFNYYYHLIMREESTQWIFDRVKEYLEAEYPGNTSNKMPCIFLHKYLVGSKFGRHNDSTTHPDQILNIGVALNDEYNGGEFVLYEPGEVIPKDVGRIYTIDSKRDHEVLEITKGERWSLILFLNAKELNIKPTQLI